MSDYDFVVVGAGPAGSSVAYRLAKSNESFKVLLLEAGGENSDPKTRVLFDRYTTFFTSPDYNWNYQTTPQPALNGRNIEYFRGKGLGGSSSINFACFTIGPKDDYERWARMVGDESFNWDNAQRRYAEMVNFHKPTNPEVQKYVQLSDWKKQSGPFDVEYTPRLEDDYPKVLQYVKEAGFEANLDINSGNPLGIGICPATANRSSRSTAASAFLEPAPANLTVKTTSQVARVLLEGKKVVGVETLTGEKYMARKEVILSAGTVDTPKILLLSGIGPKEGITPHGITVQHELSQVGQNLNDHCHFFLAAEQKDGNTSRPELYNDPAALEAARSQFLADGTGPFSYVANGLIMGFLKNEKVFDTPEYNALPEEVQQHLKLPTVPAYEFISGLPSFPFMPGSDPSKSYIGAGTVLMNPQSRGTVTISSSNPADPPVSDPKFLSHPFDRKNMTLAIQEIMRFLKTPAVAETIVKPLFMPKSESEEDIWELARETTASTWHPVGTCQMGKDGDESSVVDTNFKVKGLEGLRIVDLSVVPFVPSCHTVAWAYLTGWTAGEVLSKEYSSA